MKKIIVILLFLVFVTGCSNDASDKEKSEIMKALVSDKYIESGAKFVGHASVEAGSFDATPLYDSYDVYDIKGKYYGINFDKVYVHKSNEVRCDFKVYVCDDVRYVKNTNISENDTREYIYELNKDMIKNYCVVEDKKFFGLIKKLVIKEI